MPPASDESTAVLLWQTFAAKAETVGTTVQRAPSEAAAAALVAHAFATGSLAGRFPRVARACREPSAADTDVDRVDGPSRPGAQSNRIAQVAEQVAAAGLFAVAETGSVALQETNAGRGACFLAERLWLLVPEQAIVPTLDAALERLAGLIRDGARYVTLMTGPSRTADIERTLTIGVHGPRELAIVVVGDAGDPGPPDGTTDGNTA